MADNSAEPGLASLGNASPELAALGWDDGWAADFAPLAARGLTPARIARVHRGGCDLLGVTGPVRATFGADVLAELAGGGQRPCTGDWAGLRTWADGAVTVERVLDRRSALLRAAAAGHSRGQPLAANVEVTLVVVALDVEPDLSRLERLLTLAWNSGVPPVVVLTKADLVGDAPEVAEDFADAAPGSPVLVVSAVTGEGLDELAGYTGDGRTLALLGQSGVGKSTLVNALTGAAGAELLPTAEVGVSGKGRHVTVVRELVLLPGGGVVIDTPGLRAVGLPDVADGLDRTFADIDDLAAGCRFRDCRHVAEPGCAVLAAVSDGELTQRRLESWHKLGREAEYVASRTDARLRAEMRQRWKTVHKSLRAAGRHRP